MAQIEAIVEPDGVTDDVSRESVAFVCSHPSILTIPRVYLAIPLHTLADSLARHNGVDFTQKGVKVNVKVPDEVTVEFEVEIESDESSIEVEISW